MRIADKDMGVLDKLMVDSVKLMYGMESGIPTHSQYVQNGVPVHQPFVVCVSRHLVLRPPQNLSRSIVRRLSQTIVRRLSRTIVRRSPQPEPLATVTVAMQFVWRQSSKKRMKIAKYPRQANLFLIGSPRPLPNSSLRSNTPHRYPTPSECQNCPARELMYKMELMISKVWSLWSLT